MIEPLACFHSIIILKQFLYFNLSKKDVKNVKKLFNSSVSSSVNRRRVSFLSLTYVQQAFVSKANLKVFALALKNVFLPRTANCGDGKRCVFMARYRCYLQVNPRAKKRVLLRLSFYTCAILAFVQRFTPATRRTFTSTFRFSHFQRVNLDRILALLYEVAFSLSGLSVYHSNE